LGDPANWIPIVNFDRASSNLTVCDVKLGKGGTTAFGDGRIAGPKGPTPARRERALPKLNISLLKGFWLESGWITSELPSVGVNHCFAAPAIDQEPLSVKA
jgi:hypothetical protein